LSDTLDKLTRHDIMRKQITFLCFSKIGLSSGILALLLASPFLAGCSRDASGKRGEKERKRMAAPVTVSIAEEKTVPVQLRAVGTVEAYATVSVKAQVGGELTSVHFKEGQCVKTGDPLFTIDPRPFKAQLKQAQANLAKDRAQLDHATKQLERNASVVSKGYVSQEQYDQATANVAALKATVQADEAAVENTELQLNYCFISSPIDGCAGEVEVDQGNLVKANDNEKPLAVINQITPIYVSFYIPERFLPEVKKYMASKSLKVEALIPGQAERSVAGALTFLDNAVNPSTGTIQLKGTFPNKDRALWPGQYVNVALTLTSQPGAVVVPSQAVQTGQEGQYVFVVKPDLTVDYRRVEVGRSAGSDVVIKEGVRPGEKVVTDGQLRLTSGSPVKIVENGEREAEVANP
jgi:multidrug efflux system membrane fusion protein